PDLRDRVPAERQRLPRLEPPAALTAAHRLAKPRDPRAADVRGADRREPELDPPDRRRVERRDRPVALEERRAVSREWREQHRRRAPDRREQQILIAGLRTLGQRLAVPRANAQRHAE